eukprot:3008555-Amphidinium_carterae.1
MLEQLGMVNSNRLLLPQQDLEDRWLHKVRQKIAKLRRAKPSHISGRQAYFRDMMRKSLLVNSTVHKRGFSQRRVMSSHGEQWRVACIGSVVEPRPYKEMTCVVKAAWRSTASTNTDPVQFMQEQETMIAAMIFPFDDVKAVLELDENADLSSIAVEVRRLYSTGVAGRALMSGAVRALCEQDLQKLIEKHILMLANTDVTEALFVKTLAECKSAAEKT